MKSPFFIVYNEGGHYCRVSLGTWLREWKNGREHLCAHGICVGRMWMWDHIIAKKYKHVSPFRSAPMPSPLHYISQDGISADEVRNRAETYERRFIQYKVMP